MPRRIADLILEKGEVWTGKTIVAARSELGNAVPEDILEDIKVSAGSLLPKWHAMSAHLQGTM